MKGTKSLGINKSDIQLDAFADADFTAEISRKSTTGYLIRMYGIPVMWASRIQKSISKSTSEAELEALCAAAHDIKFLLELISELFKIKKPVTLYEGNISAIRHANLYANRSRKDISNYVTLKHKNMYVKA